MLCDRKMEEIIIDMEKKELFLIVPTNISVDTIRLINQTVELTRN